MQSIQTPISEPTSEPIERPVLAFPLNAFVISFTLWSLMFGAFQLGRGYAEWTRPAAPSPQAAPTMTGPQKAPSFLA